MGTRDEMTISRYGQGICPVCDRPIRLLKNGVIGPHGNKIRDLADPRWGQNCVGWGKQPKEG